MDVAQGTPGTPSEGGPEAVEAVLKSQSWEARLAEARARRDKVLADMPRGNAPAPGTGPRPWERAPKRPAGKAAEGGGAEGLIDALPPERREAIRVRMSRDLVGQHGSGKSGASTGTGKRAVAAPPDAPAVTTAPDRNDGIGPRGVELQPAPEAGPDGSGFDGKGFGEALRGRFGMPERDMSPGTANATPAPGLPPEPKSGTLVAMTPRGPGPRGPVLPRITLSDPASSAGVTAAGATATDRLGAEARAHRSGADAPYPMLVSGAKDVRRGAGADAVARAIRALSDAGPVSAPLKGPGVSVGDLVLPGAGAKSGSGSPAGADVVIPLPQRAVGVIRQWSASAEVPEVAVSDSMGAGAEVFRGLSAGTLYDDEGRSAATGGLRITRLAVVVGFAAGLGLGLGLTLAARLLPAGVIGWQASEAVPVSAPAGVGIASGGAGPDLPWRAPPVFGAGQATGKAEADADAVLPQAEPMAPHLGPIRAVTLVRGDFPRDAAPVAPDPAPPIGGRGPFALATVQPMPSEPEAAPREDMPGLTRRADAAPGVERPAGLSPLGGPGPVMSPVQTAPRPDVSSAPVAPEVGDGLSDADAVSLPGRFQRPDRIKPAVLSAPLPGLREPDIRSAAVPAPKPKPALAFPSVTVRLMMPAGLAEAEAVGIADGLAGRLAAAGFAAPERRQVDVAIKGDQVRFYHPDDREAAVTAAVALGAKLRDFSGSGGGKKGVVEVWLKNAAATKVAAKPAAKAKKPARAKQVVNRSAEDPLAQALRDQIIAKLRARKP